MPNKQPELFSTLIESKPQGRARFTGILISILIILALLATVFVGIYGNPFTLLPD